ASLTGTVSKVYDGTTTATLAAANVTVSGAVSGDDVSVAAVSTGTFGDKTVGTGKTVSASGLTLAGADAANYTLAGVTASAAIGTITPATLSATLTGTITKAYDGTTAVTSLSPGDYTFTGAVAGDDLSITVGSGAYADKNAGTGKTVTLSGL